MTDEQKEIRRQRDLKFMEEYTALTRKHGLYLAPYENGHESWDQNPWVWVIEFRRVEQ